MASTYASTATFTTADIETVFRRFRADILMIAESTGAITRSKADDYAHDAEYLAKKGYLSKIDLTLLSNGVEKRAAIYNVNESTGVLSSSRPGGVLWPRVDGADLRILLWYTSSYVESARETAKSKLRIGWGPSSADTSHASLTKNATRSYASNGYGLDREDLS